MMIAWLVVLAVLLYVFRALSRPQVDGEPAAAAQEEPTVVPAEVEAEPPLQDEVTAAGKDIQHEIEPFPMTPTKGTALTKEPETPTAVAGWRPDSPAPSERSTLSAADIMTPAEARTPSLQSSPSGSHAVDAAAAAGGLPPSTPRSIGDMHAFGEDGVTMAASARSSIDGGDDSGLKPPVRRGMSFKFQKTRVQSDEERQARLQAKQAAEADRVAKVQQKEVAAKAAEADRVAKVQQKEAAAEARSAARLAAAQELIAQKEALRREAEAQRQVILDQMAQTERHRQAMRNAQAAVDRAANTSALMGQVARQQALREKMAQQAAANAYLRS